jgi:hypothetical protein
MGPLCLRIRVVAVARIAGHWRVQRLQPDSMAILFVSGFIQAVESFDTDKPAFLSKKVDTEYE